MDFHLKSSDIRSEIFDHFNLCHYIGFDFMDDRSSVFVGLDS